LTIPLVGIEYRQRNVRASTSKDEGRRREKAMR
jgi:hypothetical protein